jgi:hypothetical protein
LIVADDKHNPDYGDRITPLLEVCEACETTVTTLGYDSEFYRLPTRDGQLSALHKKVVEAVKPFKHVVTHNPWGEYGHLDHILLHHWLAPIKEVMYTSAEVVTNWPFSHQSPMGWTDGKVKTLDKGRFNELAKIYKDAGVWTWNNPVPNKVTLHQTYTGRGKCK